MQLPCLESAKEIFDIFDADEARTRVSKMALSSTAQGQVQQFISKFGDQRFTALKKRSPEYLDPINDLITQFYFVSFPFCTAWIRFAVPADSPLHGKWFYFNHGRAILPMANPVFEKVHVTTMVRPMVYAWENSDNQYLLDLPLDQKPKKWPYYRIWEGDRLLIFDMNPKNVLEDAPVFTCTLRQLRDVPDHPERKELEMRQLTQVFGSYAEMLASIDQIQYCSTKFNDLHLWQIPLLEQNAMAMEPGFKKSNQFILLG
jgi:hypothetical protein